MRCKKNKTVFIFYENIIDFGRICRNILYSRFCSEPGEYFYIHLFFLIKFVMMVYLGVVVFVRHHYMKGKNLREPIIKNIYKDSTRNITFEIMYYIPMEEEQMHQVLDEYYRRYIVPAPKDGSTVKIICDSCGPLPPIKPTE